MRCATLRVIHQRCQMLFDYLRLFSRFFLLERHNCFQRSHSFLQQIGT